MLIANAIAISIDSKGAWRDNVFVERIWKSVQYGKVYLRAYASVGEPTLRAVRYFRTPPLSNNEPHMNATYPPLGKLRADAIDAEKKA